MDFFKRAIQHSAMMLLQCVNTHLYRYTNYFKDIIEQKIEYNNKDKDVPTYRSTGMCQSCVRSTLLMILLFFKL